MIEWQDDGASGRERLAPADGEQRVPRWVFVALALLTLGWLGAGPLLALSAVFGTWDLYGEAPTAAETAAAQRDAVLATVVGAGCPGLAWYLAARWRRRVAQAVFGVGAVLGLVVGLLVHGAVSPDVPDAPVRDDGPRYCQEHSGGDATCPGG